MRAAMNQETSEVPEAVSSAIAELWRIPSDTEGSAIDSGVFRSLEMNCEATYSGAKGSRLPKKPASESMRKELRLALQNFFRWNGAPWYQGSTPSEDDMALKLHRAFLATEVNRSYLAPLDRLDLEDTTQRPHRA